MVLLTVSPLRNCMRRIIFLYQAFQYSQRLHPPPLEENARGSKDTTGGREEGEDSRSVEPRVIYEERTRKTRKKCSRGSASEREVEETIKKVLRVVSSPVAWVEKQISPKCSGDNQTNAIS